MVNIKHIYIFWVFIKKIVLEIVIILKRMVAFVEKILWYKSSSNSYKKDNEFKIKKLY